MKVLFVSSGNSKIGISPIIINQGASLQKTGVDLEYFAVKGKGVRGYLKNISPLRRKIREFQPNVIHAHYSLTAFMASIAGAKSLIVSLMGSDVKSSKSYKFLIRIFSFIFNWKVIIVKSMDMYCSLGIKKAKVVPNGVDLKRFQQMDKASCQQQLQWDHTTYHILFPAEPSRPEKDYFLAQQAVQCMKSSVQQVHLHEFRNIPNDQTPLWYNAADVVLMTSKWEGSPNAIKESMACGTPIVTTNVGDVQERLSGVEGCYVASSREPSELAVLLEKALSFHGKTNGRAKLIEDGLTNDQVAQRLIEIYENVINKS